MDVVYLEGLPYLDPDYLRRRITAKEMEAARWHARARPHEARSSGESQELVRAYLSHARVAEMDAAHRRSLLAEVVAKLATMRHEDSKKALVTPHSLPTVEAFA